jgi:hypothetical protein
MIFQRIRLRVRLEQVAVTSHFVVVPRHIPAVSHMVFMALLLLVYVGGGTLFSDFRATASFRRPHSLLRCLAQRAVLGDHGGRYCNRLLLI